MMKRILAITASALLLATGLSPATAATEYSVNQKTLATFSASATGLTSMQKAQVKATVDANPNAEKFICTGIRYYSQPMSVNIMVRKRAKAACEYAKQLNPSLSTWYQNKPTQARSYDGKVLLTIKSPKGAVRATPEYNWVEGTDTIYDAACQDFKAGKLRHKHLKIYRPIIADICKDFKMNYDLVEVRYSPLVDREDLNLYVQANVFSLTYWDRFTTNGLDKRYLVILMEEEQDWWTAQLDELLQIEPVWFGPSAEAGHCYAAEPEAFCPKNYVGNDGTTAGDFDVLTTMLGSKMNWSPQRKVTAIHESTHAFQTAEGLGHWRYWFVEGQATYFEMAASVLVGSMADTNWRDQAIAESHSRDENPFKATNSVEAYEFLKKCSGKQDCNGLRYVGASFAHELLVNTYGLETYRAWNLALAEQLPDFVWQGQPEAERVQGNKMFADLFQEYFGVNIDDWERDTYSQYLVDQFS
jgi:hypothetical protein